MTDASFDDITVRDICDNCQISKATFYRYYLDKYDLLAHVYQSFVSPLIDNIENIDDHRWKNMLEDALAVEAFLEDSLFAGLPLTQDM